MSWNFVSYRGSAQNKTSGTTISVNPTANLNVEAIIIIRCSSDNIWAIDGDSSNHTVSDSKGNVWTKLKEYTISNSLPDAGVTVSLWVTRIKIQILTTDTITLTLTSAVVAKVIGIEEFSVTAGNTWALEGVPVGAVGGTVNPTVTLSGLESATHLLLGIVGCEEENSEDFTQDTDYSNNTSIGTTGVPGATNVNNRFGNRIVSITSDTYDTTVSSKCDWVCILVALDEVPIGSITSAGDIASGEDISGAIVVFVEPTYPTIKVLKCMDANVEVEIETYSLNFLTTDDIVEPFDAPIDNDLVNTSYSYETWVRFQAKGQPRLTQYSNFKVWGEDLRPDYPKNRLIIMCGTTSTGITPSSAQSTIAIYNMHSSYYSKNTALSIGGTLTVKGAKTDYLVLQLVASTNSPKGYVNETVIHFNYEEI